MTTRQLKKFFEEHNFNVHLFKEDGEQLGEIEMWTNGGVDMNILLQPFTAKEFIDYVNNFDVDEEVDLYRQDEGYRAVFRISQSLTDFTDYLDFLENVVIELENL